MSKAKHHDGSAGSLFEDLEALNVRAVSAVKQARADALRGQPARRLQPNRKQIEPRASDLEPLLDGVGSGREVARLAREHDAYRWICGGVSVNSHALQHFRSGNETLMDEVLTANVAAATWRKWRRWSGKSSNARAACPRPGASPVMTTPHHRTSTNARKVTPSQWRCGERAWPTTRSISSKGNPRPRPREVAYLYALAHNLMRMVKIAPDMMGRGTGSFAAVAAAA